MQARPLLALFAAALAAAPLAAQKPAEGDKLDPGQRWREQGIAMCVAELRAVEGMTPDDLEAICGCAFERMPSPPAGAPPEPGGDRLRGAIGGPVLACAAQQRPALASAVARWLADRPSVSPVSPPPALSMPAAEPDKPESAAAPEAAGPGFSLGAWWDGLGWPRWLSGSGVPLWVWLPLGLLVLALFARRFRRDSSRDLIRPPPHMRRTTVRPSPPPVR